MSANTEPRFFQFRKLVSATDLLRNYKGPAKISVDDSHPTHEGIFELAKEITERMFLWCYNLININFRYDLPDENLYPYCSDNVSQIVISEGLKSIPKAKKSFIHVNLQNNPDEHFKPNDEFKETPKFDSPEVQNCSPAKWFIYCLLIWIQRKLALFDRDVNKSLTLDFIEKYYTNSIFDNIDIPILSRVYKQRPQFQVRKFMLVAGVRQPNLHIYFKFDKFDYSPYQDIIVLELTHFSEVPTVYFLSKIEKLTDYYFHFTSSDKSKNKELLWILMQSKFAGHFGKFILGNPGIARLFNFVRKGLASNGPFGDFLRWSNNLYDPRILLEIEKYL